MDSGQIYSYSGQCGVFISHSVADKQIASQVVQLLVDAAGASECGIFCSTLPGSIPPGVGFVNFIARMIGDSSIVICLITASYLESQFCLAELGAAWALKKRIFPLILKPIRYSDVGGILFGVQMYDICDIVGWQRIIDEVVHTFDIKKQVVGVREPIKRFASFVTTLLSLPYGAASLLGRGAEFKIKVLLGANELYTDAARLVSNANSLIQGTSLYPIDEVGAKDIKKKYFDAIVDRLRFGRKNNSPIIFRGVSCTDTVDLSLGRIALFKKAGVSRYVKYRVVSSKISFGMLIVDSRNMHLSFPFSEDGKLHFGLAIYDNAEIVSYLSKWFQQFLWDEGDDI